MTTTTAVLPMRPRGAARHAANAAAADPSVFPTRRARLAAEAARTTDAAASTPAVSVSTTGVVASPPAASVPTTGAASSPSAASVPASRPSPTPTPTPKSTPTPASALPSRRTLRSDARHERHLAARQAVADAVTLPLRSIGSAFSSATALPVTATAVVACLVVSVATPQTALASGARAALPALDAQDFTAATTSATVAARDSFAVGLTAATPTAATTRVPAASTAGVVRPVAGAIPAAGGFGARSVRGCGACSTDHAGLDFAAPSGSAVLVTLPGRVISAGVSGGYGNQVLVQHAGGVQTRYAHLSQIGVRTGQDITGGTRVGAVGSTGVSTGPHLHFEVLIAGVPVDPADWLRARGLL